MSEHSCSSQEADPLQRQTVESPLQERTRATHSHHIQRVSRVFNIQVKSLYFLSNVQTGAQV